MHHSALIAVCAISYCQAFSISNPGIVSSHHLIERLHSRHLVRIHGVASNDVSELSVSQKLSALNSANSTATNNDEDKAPVIEAMVQQVREVVSDKKSALKRKSGILGQIFRSVVAPEMRDDFQRRMPHYFSDWTDGFKMKRQTIPAVLFLYFACLTPAVSFGTISSEITNGSIGVVEFLLSCGLSGMVSTITSERSLCFLLQFLIC